MKMLAVLNKLMWQYLQISCFQKFYPGYSKNDVIAFSFVIDVRIKFDTPGDSTWRPVQNVNNGRMITAMSGESAIDIYYNQNILKIYILNIYTEC